ncbi:MAG: ATP-binding protein [Lachnospiraceae bacterium]|nr:ATP-binding protein [Lachnospiraceae bacterium]
MPLTNSQYQEIMKEYGELQSAAQARVAERREQIYAQLPGLQPLEERIATLSVQRAKQQLAGHTPEAEALAEDLEEARGQFRALLASEGYSEEDFEPDYACRMCSDTGFIPQPDGTRRKCRCFKMKETRILYHQSNLQGLLEQCNFSNLTYEYHKGEDLTHLKGAVALCKDFVNSFETNYRNLMFYGTVGTGKSFLSCCIAAELLPSGHSVVYLSSQKLFDTLADQRFRPEFQEDRSQDFETSLYNCDLLIIDDLGSEYTNGFVETQFFALMNERDLRKRPTILSTNLSFGDLQKRYTDRIASRILGRYDIIRLTGPDLRTLI